MVKMDELQESLQNYLSCTPVIILREKQLTS